MRRCWYVEAGDTHFCWAKEPTFVCPVQGSAYEAAQPNARPAPELAAAAEALGVDVAWLARVVSRSNHYRARVDGKLTGRCQCGARMSRLGFATWVERPGPPDELRRVLGDGGTHVQDGPRRYQDTRREAEAWARRQLEAVAV